MREVPIFTVGTTGLLEMAKVQEGHHQHSSQQASSPEGKSGGGGRSQFLSMWTIADKNHNNNASASLHQCDEESRNVYPPHKLLHLQNEHSEGHSAGSGDGDDDMADDRDDWYDITSYAWCDRGMH